MARKDLYAQVAHLHAVGIDRGFLTTLGEGFLALMYQAIDETPGAVLLTELEGPRVLGFVRGGQHRLTQQSRLWPWPRSRPHLRPRPRPP